MLALRGEKPTIGVFRQSVLWIIVILVCSANAFVAFGQDQSGKAARSIPSQDEHVHQTVAPLRDLLTEAEQNKPKIASARQGWEATKQIPSQVSTLPDPQFTLQQLNVGSPRPFAGYTNSDFAYIGVGASQQLPYPGKLKLRGAVADRDFDTAKAHVEVVARDEIEKLKTTYGQLANLQQTLTILQRNDTLLQQVEDEAKLHYENGPGTVPDVLK